MSNSGPSRVFMFSSGDPEMQRAMDRARRKFRYFWRELSWERRRIIPALDLACVKAPFSDGEGIVDLDDDSRVEQMWLDDVDFDGKRVSGTLVNQPNHLRSVNKGDSARFRLREISDWMYVVDGEVYGAFTVNVMRARMSPRECDEHDEAWGLDFGDPMDVRIVPKKKNWFPNIRNAHREEHPMSANMASSFKKELASNPSLVRQKDELGWMLLHSQAAAGSLATVEVLLKAGANPNAMARNGATPLRLAKVLGWEKVAALLIAYGATT